MGAAFGTASPCAETRLEITFPGGAFDPLADAHGAGGTATVVAALADTLFVPINDLHRAGTGVKTEGGPNLPSLFDGTGPDMYRVATTIEGYPGRRLPLEEFDADRIYTRLRLNKPDLLRGLTHPAEGVAPMTRVSPIGPRVASITIVWFLVVSA